MKSAQVAIAIGVWLSAGVAGAWWLHQYDSAPGSSRPCLTEWPAETGIQADHDRPTLVFFAHPQCPCTRASIEELNRLLARCSGQVATRVLFFQPTNPPANWTRSSLWKSAAAIPGVVVQPDRNGVEAARFGAETSGFVTLFDVSGHLLFRGGITASRGHAGDNVGADAIVSLVNGAPARHRQTPVFGCGLLDKCTLSKN